MTATGYDDDGTLDEETIEWFTDVMVRKLRGFYPTPEPRPDQLADVDAIQFRDMVRQVVVDTAMLASGATTRDGWEDAE